MEKVVQHLVIVVGQEGREADQEEDQAEDQEEDQEEGQEEDHHETLKIKLI